MASPAGAQRRPSRACVTGASAGIGAAFAARLARDRHDLLLVARSRDRLDTLAEQIRRETEVHVEVLAADLTKPAELRATVERVGGDGGVDVLVNNAGTASVGLFHRLDPDREEAMIRLNVVAVVALTRAALPAMVARGHGTIINVSSIAAFVPVRFRATYGATKAFTNSFTEALHEELRGTGVRVQALCPGFTHTDLHEGIGVRAAAIPAFAWMTPQAVVDAALAGVRRGTLVCVPGVANRLVAACLSILPHRLARRLASAGAKRGWASLRVGGS